MRRYLQVLLGLMLLLSSAAAQNADTEEFIARMRAFTSVFNLAFIIDQFPVLET